MSDKDFNGKDIGKKVKAMEKKTREAQKYFNLPETETVIQDYACAHGAPGRMYITQNYIGFKGGSNIICILFQKVKSVQKTKLTSIEIEADKTYTFSTFANRIEAFYLLDHLSKNVPSYSKKTERQQLLGNEGEGGEEGDYSLGFGDMLEMDSQVDTGSTRRALQRLNEAKENGANALNELSRQREVIDKINNNLDYIEYKLDDNEKNISSMESFGGMMSSAFKGDKKMNDYITHREHKEIEVKAIKKPDLKIDILFKHKNDELTPSTLVLKGQGFVIFKAGTEKLVETKPESSWKYEQVKQAVLRARHQHLDVWFVEGKRIRLMSAHVQAIVNELYLRHPDKSIGVEFEPGVLKFDYGHPSISYSLGKKQSGVSGTGINSTNLISDKVSPQVKKQLAQQDKDIDEMNNGLDTLLGMANAMNTELINSEGQIDEMKRKMENVDYKMGKQQHGLQNILDS